MEAQEALDAERRRYQELFDLAPVSYLVTDLKGRIQEANQAAIEMLRSNPQAKI
jgi:PAS domain S-box-containing protein